MKNPEKPYHTQVFQQKIIAMQRRVSELRALGFKHYQIQEKLAEEGHYWSLDTISDDLKSETAEQRREEL